MFSYDGDLHKHCNADERSPCKTYYITDYLFSNTGRTVYFIGAPATLAASSVLEKTTGNKMLFFDLLPMGTIIFVIGTLYICTLGCRKGTKMWQKVTTTDQIMLYDNESLQTVDRKKCIVTAVAGGLMLVLFITETFSVGTVSLIGALICIFGGVVKQKHLSPNWNWNILIWLGCSIGMANVLNESGVIQVVVLPCKMHFQTRRHLM